MSSKDLGDRIVDSTFDFTFNTHTSAGVPTSLLGSPTLAVYKNNSITETTAGATLTVDFDGITGLNHVRMVLTDVFYDADTDYSIVISAGTVGGQSVAGTTVGTFSVSNRILAALPNNFSDMAITLTTGFVSANLTAGALTNVQTECNTALVGQRLDHLLATSAVAGDVADDSIMAQLASSAVTAAWTSYDNTTDSQEAIAAAAGDPWATALPGAYGAGTAGNILGNRLDAVLTDRTILAADYFDPDADTVANVTTVATTTTNTDMITTAAVNAEVDTALSDIGLHLLVNTALPTDWSTDVTANSALDYLADDGTGTYNRNGQSLLSLAALVGISPEGSIAADLDVMKDDGIATYDRLTDSQQAIRDNQSAGGTDWTSGEKENIRDALGVDGTKTAATGGQLQGTLDANVTEWLGATPPTPTNAGVPETDGTHINGVPINPAAVPDVNVIEIAGNATPAEEMGRFYNALQAGIAQSATANTLRLAAGAVDADNDYDNAFCKIVEATTGANQPPRKIISSTSIDDVVTLDANWDITPTGTIRYQIIGYVAP